MTATATRPAHARPRVPRPRRLVARRAARLPAAAPRRALLEHAVARSPFYREALAPDRPPRASCRRCPSHVDGEWDRIACDPAAEPGRRRGARRGLAAGPLPRALPGRHDLGRERPARAVRLRLEDFACLDGRVAAPAPALRRAARMRARSRSPPATRCTSPSRSSPRCRRAARHAPAPARADADAGDGRGAATPTRPTVLMGYSGVLGLLADEQLSGRLGSRPRPCCGTSEPLTADIRARHPRGLGHRSGQRLRHHRGAAGRRQHAGGAGRARDPRRRAHRRGRRRRQPPGGAGRDRREGPDHEPRELHVAADPLRAGRPRDARRRPEPDRPAVLAG